MLYVYSPQEDDEVNELIREIFGDEESLEEEHEEEYEDGNEMWNETRYKLCIDIQKQKI